MIIREDAPDAVVLRINHGPVGAMDSELCRAVVEHLDRLAAEDHRGVVLTGTGRVFSAGVDLRRIQSGGPGYLREFLPALSAMIRAAFAFPMPLVAALNGHAIAGGYLLAACADRILMADGPGRISMPELSIGVTVPQAGLEVLRHRLGNRALPELLHGGGAYQGADIPRLGLADELVDPPELLVRACATAARLATSIPSDAFQATKLQLRRPALGNVSINEDDDAATRQIWLRRLDDGSIAKQLASRR